MKELGAVEFDAVVAADLGEGIGAADGIPWKLPADLAHLKKLTTDTAVPGTRNAVVMGRKTWDTIPERWRPLPGRLNLVVSRQRHLAMPEGVLLTPSLENALASARAVADVERIFVLGGGDIYRQCFALDGCRRIYLTRVLGRFECDTFLAPIPSRFRRESLMGEGQDGGVGYRIEVWSAVSSRSG
jgi:dihydrofolate reductase